MKGFFNWRMVWQSFGGIFMFIAITLIIHFTFRYWANHLNFYPLEEKVTVTRDWLADMAFRHTAKVMKILGYQFDDARNTITYEDGRWLAINKSCSGFKQLLQAFFLFLLFPGPLKHKLWFVPLAMVLMHVANIIRLVGVAITLYYFPDWWEFSHDYVFRFVFYLILFLLWIVWEEKFRLQQSSTTHTNKV
jgi:exosortase/archaeosortase family protein